MTEFKKIIFLFLVITGFKCFAVDIYIADLNIYREEVNVELTEQEKMFTKTIFDSIIRKDFDGLLKMKSVDQSGVWSNRIVKSPIEASELCELLNIDYLLYGFIRKTNSYYDAEIRLFDNARKDNIKVFYAKMELSDIANLSPELASKITDYLYTSLGLSEYQRIKKEKFGGVGIYNGVGYWIPIGNWWNVLTGIVHAETGINVMPVNSIIDRRNFDFSIRFGFLVSYGFALTKSGLLSAYHNDIIFKTPIDFCFDIFSNHTFIIGIGPQFQMDIVYQKLLFDNPKTLMSYAASMFLSCGYEYWFGKNKYVGFGVNNIFNFTFYKNMYTDYRIEFYVLTRLKLDYSQKKNAVRMNKDTITN